MCVEDKYMTKSRKVDKGKASMRFVYLLDYKENQVCLEYLAFSMLFCGQKIYFFEKNMVLRFCRNLSALQQRTASQVYTK